MTTKTEQLFAPAEVAAALEEKARVDKLNRPTLDYNKQVMVDNIETKTFFEALLLDNTKGGCTKAACHRAAMTFWRHKKKLPFVLDEPHATVLKREYANNKMLKRRKPSEWLSLIKALPKRLRPAVASLVWWDYFSHRSCKKRWEHLDFYLYKFWKVREAEDGDVQACLATLGYSPYQVSVRLNNID